MTLTTPNGPLTIAHTHLKPTERESQRDFLDPLRQINELGALCGRITMLGD